MGKSYEQWKDEVNSILHQRFGFSMDEMPDQEWYDMYDNSVSPEEAAQDAIRNEDGPDDDESDTD